MLKMVVATLTFGTYRGVPEAYPRARLQFTVFINASLLNTKFSQMFRISIDFSNVESAASWKAPSGARPEIGISPRAPKNEEATRPLELFTMDKDNRSFRGKDEQNGSIRVRG